MLVGLDVSTAIVGISSCTGTDYSFDYVDLRKLDGLNAKADAVRARLQALLSPGDSVYIEDRLAGFSRGMTTQHTLLHLAAFNGIVTYICHTLTGKEPIHIHPSTLKSKLRRGGLVIPPRTPRDKKKLMTMEWARMRVQNFPVELGRTGKPKDWCFDIADAYAVLVCGTSIDAEKGKDRGAPGDPGERLLSQV